MCTFTHKSTEIIQCIPTSHPEDLYIGCLALKLYNVTFIIIIITFVISSLSGVGSLSVTLMRSYIFVFSGILMTLHYWGQHRGAVVCTTAFLRCVSLSAHLHAEPHSPRLSSLTQRLPSSDSALSL